MFSHSDQMPELWPWFFSLFFSAAIDSILSLKYISSSTLHCHCPYLSLHISYSSHLPTELLVLHRNQRVLLKMLSDYVVLLKTLPCVTTALHSLHYKALLASLAALPTIYPLFLKFQLPVFFTFSCWPVSVFCPPAWNPLSQLFVNSSHS